MADTKNPFFNPTRRDIRRQEIATKLAVVEWLEKCGRLHNEFNLAQAARRLHRQLDNSVPAKKVMRKIDKQIETLVAYAKSLENSGR